MIFLQLFATFFKIGLFAIGGAYSFLPLVEREVVQGHKWLGRPEFLEVVGMVEVVPGAISVKFAAYIGYKVAGVPGAAVASVGNLLPPVLFMMLAAVVYRKYSGASSVRGALEMVRYAVVAMIIAIGIRMMDRSHLLDPKVLLIVVVAFLLLTLTRIHPALVIIGAAVYGGLVR